VQRTAFFREIAFSPNIVSAIIFTIPEIAPLINCVAGLEWPKLS
jgi:hypothetical protein